MTNANLGSAAAPPLLSHLQHLHLNCHAHLPRVAWSALLARCTGLTSLDITHCDGLTDTSLECLLSAHPAALAHLTSLAIRGDHRGDVSLTERSVEALRTRAPGLALGDTFSWSLQGPDLRIVAGSRGARGL